MERRSGPCEAQTHNANCPCQTCRTRDCGNCRETNVDHFTPKCIGKLLGWSKKQIDAPDNLQMLSYPCHEEKDKDTPIRKLVVQKQLAGETFTLERHADIFVNHNYKRLNKP